jgi:hypothetical protein
MIILSTGVPKRRTRATPARPAAMHSSSDITIVYDLGLFVSVPLATIGLVRVLRGVHERRRERTRAALRLDGERLREGPVIVEVTRATANGVQLADGGNLRVDAGPFPLALGERGEVLGRLVHAPNADEAGYRAPGHAWVGHLAPLGRRYLLVPRPRPARERHAMGCAGALLSALVTAMALLAGCVHLSEPGDVRNMLSAWWFGLVMVLVALIMLFAPDLWLPTPRSPADVAAPRRPGRA